MTNLPRGTVTLLFTDVEGSTRLLQEVGLDEYVRALEDHRRLLRQAFDARGGVEVEMQGDSFHYAFAEARAAVLAAADAQRALAEHTWEIPPIRVRIGMHTGTPRVTGRLYAGLDVHRAARVMSAGSGGQVLLSETTRALLGDGMSVRDLGEHRLKDLSAPQRLFQLGDEDFPPLKSLYRTNLPVSATPFLGRERELQEVSALLGDESVRLLTLTGPGGSGKTRLAAQAAAEVSEQFPDGVFWVGLADLRDSELVATSIAQVLGTNDDLSDHLGSKQLLLLLDNFEHLLPASSELAGLLAACPGLTMLVTSRESLHLAAEREYAVASLREADAVLLFSERARAVGIAVGEQDVVAEICRRLDGLPLAIELAAARAKVLSPHTMLERLEPSFALLTGGPRDAPERQRTLRSTIAWSYGLLTADEQQFFGSLAVFAGGCTLDAAEQICETQLDTLESLVDKSLLRRTAERFWMLETIREYAAERLRVAPDAAELQQRHTEWYIDSAERAYTELRGADQALWLERIEQDHGNFRSVLGRTLGAGESEAALHLASFLARFWIMRGYLDEGSRWLERCLGSAGTSPSRPRALRGLAILARERGDLDRAAQAAQEALAVDRAAGDEAGVTQSIGLLADVVAFQGDLSRAKVLYEEVAELARAQGDRLELAVTLYSLGQVARLQGDLQGAGNRFEEALAISREQEDALGQAAALQSLVEVASERGDHERALSLLRRSTELLQGIGYVSGLLDSLDTSAGLLAKLGEAEAAARLWGAYQVQGREIGRDSAHPLEAAARDESVAALRAALGDRPFDQAWTEGGRMTLDEAVAFALERAPVATETA